MFNFRFYIFIFLIGLFFLGIAVGKILPQEKFIPEKDSQEKPFCHTIQFWMYDEKQKGYWNQAYCHYPLLRQKDGFPRLFTAEEISNGVISKSKF